MVGRAGAGVGLAFAPYFDIDWTKHEGRVLLPVLGRSLAAVIADGELAVAFEAGVAVLSYYDHRFPIGPGTPARLVRSLVSVRPEPSPEGILAEGSSDDSSSDDSSADDSSADDCYADNMAELLGHQHYRLASWRLGRHEGNYRRFFDVDGLVGVRVEDPAVYEATHPLLLRLADDERVAGLRVDHVDGLADPTGYLAQLAPRPRSRPADPTGAPGREDPGPGRDDFRPSGRSTAPPGTSSSTWLARCWSTGTVPRPSPSWRPTGRATIVPSTNWPPPRSGSSRRRSSRVRWHA